MCNQLDRNEDDGPEVNWNFDGFFAGNFSQTSRRWGLKGPLSFGGPGFKRSCLKSAKNSWIHQLIWMFPKMMLPPKHPKIVIFSRKTNSCWGNPPFLGNPHIYFFFFVFAKQIQGQKVGRVGKAFLVAIEF